MLNPFFEPLSKIFLGEEQLKNKKLFTEYVLNSFEFFNGKDDQIECFTCKNFRAQVPNDQYNLIRASQY